MEVIGLIITGVGAVAGGIGALISVIRLVKQILAARKKVEPLTNYNARFSALEEALSYLRVQFEFSQRILQLTREEALTTRKELQELREELNDNR